MEAGQQAEVAPSPPTQLFNVYWMTDASTKREWLGGSYDNISAVTIACSVFNSLQDAYQQNALVGVFDGSDKAIAFIGGAGGG